MLLFHFVISRIDNFHSFLVIVYPENAAQYVDLLGDPVDVC